MRATYDRSVDAAKIYLRDIEPGGAKHTVPVWAEEGLAAGDVILDFDGNGRLIGIEVLNASKTLPAEVLDSAERIG